MRRISLIWILGVIGTMATGCGPIYDTQYRFTPPESSGGRACVYQCENAKQQCHQIEDMRADTCRDRSERDAERCRNDLYWRKGRDPKWYECGTESCSADYERCEQSYRSCYQSCGGQVDAETRCVANCSQVSTTPTTTGNAPPAPSKTYNKNSYKRY